ncbi:MAG: methylmalonyl Co-A mutase-associated GTPase MeaB [Rhodobiaceae bacterium]|nr:methylmalonyl Co-A mutase-associated GTPase MeaB [Rhodobiaceae bacterium]MCC0054798.1 methylmalonyl Co-A mutase-associated GTPase MeaB [Rhodobiaceae bacterium]
MAVPTLDQLRSGGKRSLAEGLTLAETRAGDSAVVSLLDAACAAPKGDVIGITGPPGVGKSTLTNALIARWRAAGLTVGVIAVDPSSRYTRGALLGDRTRIRTNPEDDGIFVRSMAARDRLGGLSAETVAAMVLMRAVYDRVIVESVGIGQSEADIGFVADCVILCVQPGSGDSLQYMKAGITELPDIFVVTKGDTGKPAMRARADVEGALGLNAPSGRKPAVLVVSSTAAEGFDGLDEAVNDMLTATASQRDHRRSVQEDAWVNDAIRERFGRDGLARMKRGNEGPSRKGPFTRIAQVTQALRPE